MHKVKMQRTKLYNSIEEESDSQWQTCTAHHSWGYMFMSRMLQG